jgi:hypothetical protein
MIDSQPSHPCSKTLVEPQFAPPVHGHEVAKPLMGEFVGNDVCNAVLITLIGLFLIKKYGSGSSYELLASKNITRA